MTKNSSSKHAVAQIRTQLSAVGIETSYTAARRLYDATEPGPQRLSKAVSSGITDYAAAVAGTPEQQAARGVQPIKLPAERLRNAASVVVGVDADGEPVFHEAVGAANLLVFGQDHDVTAPALNRLASAAGDQGAKLVVIDFSRNLASLRSRAHRYIDTVEGVYALLRQRLAAAEDYKFGFTKRRATKQLWVIDSLDWLLEFTPEGAVPDGADRPARAVVTPSERDLRVRCSALLWDLRENSSHGTTVFTALHPMGLERTLSEHRWRHLHRGSSRLLLDEAGSIESARLQQLTARGEIAPTAVPDGMAVYESNFPTYGAVTAVSLSEASAAAPASADADGMTLSLGTGISGETIDFQQQRDINLMVFGAEEHRRTATAKSLALQAVDAGCDLTVISAAGSESLEELRPFTQAYATDTGSALEALSLVRDQMDQVMQLCHETAVSTHRDLPRDVRPAQHLVLIDLPAVLVAPVQITADHTTLAGAQELVEQLREKEAREQLNQQITHLVDTAQAAGVFMIATTRAHPRELAEMPEQLKATGARLLIGKTTPAERAAALRAPEQKPYEWRAAGDNGAIFEPLSAAPVVISELD